MNVVSFRCQKSIGVVMVETNQVVQIRIKDLLALIVRYAKPIIVFAIICALLFAGYKGFSSYSDMYLVSDSDYYREVSEYNAQKKTLTLQMDQTQHLIDAERQYIDESLLMQIDPNNEYVTSVYAAISGVDTSSIGEIIASGDVPESYLTNRISSLYGAYWETIDLQDALKSTSVGNVSDKYLREVISFSRQTGGVLAIKVIGSNMNDTEQLANMIFDVLAKYKDTVVKNSYNHTLTLIGSSTKTVADYELTTAQQSHYTTINDNRALLETQKSTIKSLSMPDSIAKNSIKFAILGLIIGVFIGVCWIIVKKLFGDYVISSQQINDYFELDCIGSAYSAQKSSLTKSAAKISGDPCFANSQNAISYIQESAKIRLQDAKNVLLVSTLDIPSNNAEIGNIISCLKSAGYSAEFVGNANRNPKLFTGASNCDNIILIESICKTKLSSISDVCNKMEFAKKPVAGFILV